MTGFYMITASVMKELTEEHDKMLNDSITATQKNASDSVKKKSMLMGSKSFETEQSWNEWQQMEGTTASCH